MNHASNTIELSAPVREVFDYYADPANVVRMAPPDLNARLLEGQHPLRKGSRVVFSIRPSMMPVQVRWVLEITEFEENSLFVDELRKGPFAHWVHRHHFAEGSSGGTRLTDEIEFDAPVPLFAWIARRNFVQARLADLFAHRERVLRRDLENHAPSAG